jgi:hypothetical protein
MRRLLYLVLVVWWVVVASLPALGQLPDGIKARLGATDSDCGLPIWVVLGKTVSTEHSHWSWPSSTGKTYEVSQDQATIVARSLEKLLDLDDKAWTRQY